MRGDGALGRRGRSDGDGHFAREADHPDDKQDAADGAEFHEKSDHEVVGIADFLGGGGEAVAQIVGPEIRPADPANGMAEKHPPGSRPVSPPEIEAGGGQAAVEEAVGDDGEHGEDDDG